MDLHPETLVHINDFELHDFVDDANFDQFINSIRGENEDDICSFSSDLLNGCFVDNTFLSYPANPFDQCNSNSVNVYDPSSTLSSFSFFDEEEPKGESGEAEEGENSSETTTITTATTSVNTKSRPKTDRSKTLISERRRRGRMKDKLYALRSLVPNITKMDKASIIGDAVSYVYELQAQAKKLKAEVAGLETSLLVSENYQGSIENPMKVQFTDNSRSIYKKIIQMDMFQVDEREFYVKIVCNKGEGVAASLYKSLESLTGFNVKNSNLATASDSILLTFSLNVKGSEPEINLPNLKLWVTGAFLNQGFQFIPSFHT
ncbi:Myc-type, basic helix-loop-helix [Sesbania bispinosa]|nr:Myc-type, basic helix-loop-helix [Sesbania bispinosa]